MLKDPDGQYLGFASDPKNDTATVRGTVIVFHGNGAYAPQRDEYVTALQPRGFRVILFEYRGYGGRPGHPNEKEIVADGRDLVKRVAASGQGPIYLFGESIGSGVASAVAADKSVPVAGIVLITPFSSLVDVSWYHYPYVPVPLLLRDQYNSVGNLASFTGPIFILQAGEDHTVPASSTDKLFAGLPVQKMRVVIPDCDHSDWPGEHDAKWWDQAVDFITQKPAVH